MGRFLTRRKAYVLAFLVAAVLGLAARVYGRDVVVVLFGEGLFNLTFVVPRLLLPALVALLVGYVLPKGFFLWGVAVLLLHPIAEASAVDLALDAGVISSSDLSGLLVVTAITLVVFMALCTVAAALGAGLRLLWWRVRGESVRGRLGVASEG